MRVERGARGSAAEREGSPRIGADRQPAIWRIPAECDPTRVCELLVGLGDVEVLGVDDEQNAPLRVHIRRRAPRPPCGGCGGPLWSNGERPVESHARVASTSYDLREPELTHIPDTHRRVIVGTLRLLHSSSVRAR